MNLRGLSQSGSAERVALNGNQILVRSVGDGPEVVVLHGGPGADHASLAPYLDPLARSRKLRYYDQRGSGGSRVAARVDLGWQSHVEDLAALTRRWRSGPSTLVGHSWGCLLALLYTAAHPASVARLALIAPAPVTARHRIGYLRRLTERLADPKIAAGRWSLEQSGLRKADPLAYRQRASELSIMPYLRDHSKAVNVKPFVVSTRVRDAVWRSLESYDMANHVTDSHIPAIVIHGRHDPIPLDSSRQIASMLGCALEIFENSGHLPFVEEAEHFIEVLDEFLPKERR